MSVAEPVTLLTDYALAAFAAWFAWQLRRHGARERARLLWAAGFLALALAAVAGGTHHGFSPLMSTAAAGLLWKITVIAVGVFSFAVMAAAAHAVTVGMTRIALLALASLQLMVYCGWMIAHDAYRYVVLDTAVAMATLLVLHGWARVARRDLPSTWILGGVAVSAVAAAIQFYRIAPHEHFNHNDLYHVIQIGALALFYRGSRLLRDRTTPVRDVRG